jgi:hypothetical protein
MGRELSPKVSYIPTKYTADRKYSKVQYNTEQVHTTTPLQLEAN